MRVGIRAGPQVVPRLQQPVTTMQKTMVCWDQQLLRSRGALALGGKAVGSRCSRQCMDMMLDIAQHYITGVSMRT